MKFLNKENKDKLKDLYFEKIQVDLAPYMSKDLYTVLQCLYEKGEITVEKAIDYLIEKGKYVYTDRENAYFAAPTNLDLLLEKGYIEKSGNLYTSKIKKYTDS